MPHPSPRSLVLWQEAKRAASGEIRDMIEAVADVLRDTLRDKVQELYDRIELEMTDRLDTAATQVTTALATKAPLNHTHPRSEIAGLNGILSTLDARLTALEARVTTLEGRP